MAGYKQANAHEDSAVRVKKPDPAQRSLDVGPKPHPVVSLQSQLGNRQVSRMLQREADPVLAQREGDEELEAKHDLALAQRAEEDELEAKHDPALAQREAAPGEEEEELAAAKHDPALAQRAAAPEEEEELMQGKHDPALAQRQEMPEEEELGAKHDPALVRRAAATVGLEGGPVGDDLSQRIESKRGSGSGLGESTRNSMEGAFGADFSGVKVHQDAESDQLSRNMTAKAFTTGQDIFLRQDQNAGDHSLIAHELTHVVQQTSGKAADTGGGMTVGAADDPHEHEADAVAAAVTSGASVPARKVEEVAGR
jgi:hypothetical protein